MGVVPLQFPAGESWESLGLDGTEIVSITGLEQLNEGVTPKTITVTAVPSESADSPAGNCSGSTPIPMRFERWIRSKLSVMTARTPSSAVPLAAQSRDEPEPYSLPPRITSGTPAAAYACAAS